MNFKNTTKIVFLALLILSFVKAQDQQGRDLENKDENTLDQQVDSPRRQLPNEDNLNEQISNPSNTGKENQKDQDNKNSSDGKDSVTTDKDNNGSPTGNPKEEELGESYKGIKSKEIQIGERFSVNQIIQSNQSYQPAGFFSFHVKQKLPLKDFIFSVSGREDQSHSPVLYYSKTNKFPDMSHSNDISCEMNGHDFCVIPSKQIEQDDTFYLGVFCQLSCKFEIDIKYDTIFTLMLDEQIRYESASFSNSKFTLDAKIIFPADLDASIQHVLIESFILNQDVVQSGIHMYVNKGAIAPTAALHDFSGEALKQNGQSILIEREQNGFSGDSIFSVSIQAPSQAQILLRSESFARERPLYFSKYSEDMVKQGNIRFFKLEITAFASSEWDFQEISFDLEPYSGNPDLYISHGYLPEDPNNLDSYQWKSVKQDGIESLTISKNHIGKQSLIGETFYIAVVGQTAASFKIMAYSSSLSQRELHFNTVENGYASYSNLIQYQFLLQQDIDSDITIKLFTLQGEAHLFLKMCKDAQICYSNVNVCKWVVGVFGASQDKTEYRLLGKHTSTPVQLRENQEHHSMLIEGDSEYYVFSLNQEDESIATIEFSFKTITGEFTVCSSRTNPECNSVDNEFAENTNQNMIAYHKNGKNPSLKGSYYIGVKGISGCVFTVNVKIYHKVVEFVDPTLKRIPQGIAEKGYLDYNKPIKYYFVVPEYERSPIHQTNIVLNFNTYKTEINPHILIYPLLAVHYHINGQILPVITSQNPHVSEDLIYMKIYSNFTDGGQYVITLSHSNVDYKDYQLLYYLNVNPFNIAYIVPRIPFILDLELRKSDNYEIIVDQPSKVYLEVFECFGKVHLEAAKSDNAIELKQFDVISNAPYNYIGDHTIVNYNTNRSGSLYFSVFATEGSDILNNMKALYLIIPHVLPANQVLPHDVFSTPYEDQISTTVSLKKDEHFPHLISDIKVDFGAIKCINNCADSIYKPVHYTYIIHVSNNASLTQYYTKCNMPTDSLQNLGINSTNHIYQFNVIQPSADSLETNFSVTFPNLPNGTYYLNIRGVVFLETLDSKSGPEQFNFIYPMHQFLVGSIIPEAKQMNQLELEENQKDSFSFQWIMVPLCGFFILLVIIFIYKQIKTFFIRRSYRIANESKVQDQEMVNQQEDDSDEGQINDEDEGQESKKVDNLNILK